MNPSSASEWQEVVDLAHTLLLIDSAHKYHLVTGGPEVNIERCESILRAGRERGVLPRRDAVERLFREGA